MEADLIRTWTRAAAAKMAMVENFMVNVCVCKGLGRLESLRVESWLVLRLLWQID